LSGSFEERHAIFLLISLSILYPSSLYFISNVKLSADFKELPKFIAMQSNNIESTNYITVEPEYQYM